MSKTLSGEVKSPEAAAIRVDAWMEMADGQKVLVVATVHKVGLRTRSACNLWIERENTFRLMSECGASCRPRPGLLLQMFSLAEDQVHDDELGVSAAKLQLAMKAMASDVYAMMEGA